MTEVFIFTESTSVLQVKRDKFIEHFNVPSNWNVSLITDMSNLFANTQCNFSLHTWDVSNVTNMENMFENSQFNQSLDSWVVSKVKI